MARLIVRRGMAHILVRLVVRPAVGDQPTDGGQDKNREVRCGRSVEERRHIRRFARGATAHNSLPIDTTPSKTATTRTSRAPAS
jgi:hypothetical protein